MDAGPVGTARERLQQAIAQLTDAAGPTAAADEVIDALRVCEEAPRPGPGRGRGDREPAAAGRVQ